MRARGGWDRCWCKCGCGSNVRGRGTGGRSRGGTGGAGYRTFLVRWWVQPPQPREKNKLVVQNGLNHSLPSPQRPPFWTHQLKELGKVLGAGMRGRCWSHYLIVCRVDTPPPRLGSEDWAGIGLRKGPGRRSRTCSLIPATTEPDSAEPCGCP